MNDREFLIWMHERLTEVHGESPFVDYMHRFRAIISTIPIFQNTPNDGRGCNGIDELKKKLFIK